MKILCFIDSLGSGGAQRQLVNLAIGLNKRGHQIRFLVYHQDDHFLPLLQKENIPCQVIHPCGYVQRVLEVRRILRKGWQDVVLSFLWAPSLYAEVARVPKLEWGLVVGERSANPKMKRFSGVLLKQFHRLADAVVCNSHTNRLMLEVTFPFLIKKLSTVYNMVDLTLFRTAYNRTIIPFRIVVAASYHVNKNIMNVAKALLILKEKNIKSSFVLDWFGALRKDSNQFKQAELFIAENEISTSLRLHLAIRDIVDEFSRADAVALFSFFEGIPNAVCEGMACGKPILMSNVCDASNLVISGKNGFVCDPESPEDIAEKIQNLVELNEFEHEQMGRESRRLAEWLFDENTVLDKYEQILKSVANHKRLSTNCTWPSYVPQSALKTVERWRKA